MLHDSKSVSVYLTSWVTTITHWVEWEKIKIQGMSKAPSVYQMQNLGQNLCNSVVILYVMLSQKQDLLSGFFIRQRKHTHSLLPKRNVCLLAKEHLWNLSYFTMEFQNYVKENKHRKETGQYSTSVWYTLPSWWSWLC